jgi:hypothetical protein
MCGSRGGCSIDGTVRLGTVAVVIADVVIAT